MKFPFKTEEQLEEAVNKLRQAGVYTVSVLRCRAEIIATILENTNPRRKKYRMNQLPRFAGNFKEFEKACILFFNALPEKKKTKW